MKVAIADLYLIKLSPQATKQIVQQVVAQIPWGYNEISAI
jgi:hypothetical protein